MKIRKIYESILSERKIKINDLTFYDIGSRGTMVAYDTVKNMNDLDGRNPMFTVDQSTDGYEIRGTFIPENLQRKGIATRFFKYMNDESNKKTKQPLKLSNDLSVEGKKLIQGLISKGLVTDNGGEYYFK